MSPSKQSYEEYVNKPKVVGVNNWKASGKVLKKIAKYSGNGNLIVTILVEVPAKNIAYNTQLWLKAFNGKTEDKAVADQIEKNVSEGDNYHFSGSFKTSEYKDKQGETRRSQDLVIWKLEPAGEIVPVEVKEEDPPF